VATREIDGQCSADTSLPEHWLSSPTGGVAIEVSIDSYDNIQYCGIRLTWIHSFLTHRWRPHCSSR
jgi:hypothetical protein